jgi:hypothetical protein
LDRVCAHAHERATVDAKQLLERRSVLADLLDAQDIIRLEVRANPLAGLPIAGDLGKRDVVAHRRRVVRYLQIGELDDPHGAVPPPQQREQHRESAAVAPARDNHERFGVQPGREPAVKAIQPQGMLEGGGTRACEQLQIFGREKVIRALEDDLEHRMGPLGRLILPRCTTSAMKSWRFGLCDRRPRTEVNSW